MHTTDMLAARGSLAAACGRSYGAGAHSPRSASRSGEVPTSAVAASAAPSPDAAHHQHPATYCPVPAATYPETITPAVLAAWAPMTDTEVGAILDDNSALVLYFRAKVNQERLTIEHGLPMARALATHNVVMRERQLQSAEAFGAFLRRLLVARVQDAVAVPA